jgi:hypothetical protein
MRDFSRDHRWLSINTATVRKSRGVELPLPDIIDSCARRGIRAISPWRDQVQAAGLENVSKLVKSHGLELSGYCRGGMFPASTRCPAHSRASPSTRTSPSPAPRCGMASRSCWSIRVRSECRSPSNHFTRCTPPTVHA